jgi:6-hydroxytryprostatin B O-methyltransferase
LHACKYIYHFKIAEAVPLNKQITYADLAATTQVDESQLKQVLRQAMTSHIFCEPQPGYVAHTSSSRLFLVDGPKNVIGFVTEDMMPIVNGQIGALEQWGHGSPEANESAFSHAFDTNMSLFQFYKQDPVRGPRFAKSMHYLTRGDGHSVKNVVEGFDWLALGTATVVDLAGSMGHCSVAIAEAAPDLKFIVQDLPNVVAIAQSPATTIVPAGLRDRVSFIAHDFFQPQPVKAECYFIRFTLHVYSDKYAIKILQGLGPALEPGTKVIIMDQIMPPMSTVPYSVENRAMRTMDLNMMTLFNARERNMDEWEMIVKAADSRLKIKNVVTPPGSVLSVLELVVVE